MTILEIKSRLRQYRALRAEAQQIADQIELVKSSLYSPGSQTVDGMPHAHGAGTDPLCNPVARKLELEAMYKDKQERVDTALMWVEAAIASLDPEQRVLLRYRYIDGAEWEQIAGKMNYSLRAVHYHHRQALRELQHTCTM